VDSWWDNYGWWVLIIVTVVVLAGANILLGNFSTREYSVVMQSPTEEQILGIYSSSNDENRFWVEETSKIYGDNSLVELKVIVRRSEGEVKIEEVMDKIGITNYAIGYAGRR